ncbi:MAG: HAD family acid phosphatase [Vulcanimicrobiota bacterium]
MLYHNDLDATVYYQQAAETAALYYQAFALAQLRLVAEVEKRRQAGQPENSLYVVSDCDETLVDNSDFNSWLMQTGRDYHDTTWSQWCQERKARATPGAVEFAKFVVEHGASLIYVSSRFEADRQATADNLRALGFPLEQSGTDPDTTQLFLTNMLINGAKSKKRQHFDYLLKRFGAGPLLQLGDNLSDHEADRYSYKVDSEQRKASAIKDSRRWGEDWIVFPNPIYGAWRSSLKVSDEQPPSRYQPEPVRPPLDQAPKLSTLSVWLP